MNEVKERHVSLAEQHYRFAEMKHRKAVRKMDEKIV